MSEANSSHSLRIIHIKNDPPIKSLKRLSLSGVALSRVEVS
jgi:hypothetical protein